MKKFNVTVIRTTKETYRIETQSEDTLVNDVGMHERLRDNDPGMQYKITHYQEIYPSGSTVYYCPSPGEVLEYKVLGYSLPEGYTLDRGEGKSPLHVSNTKHLASSYWEVGYSLPGREAKDTRASLDDESATELLKDLVVDTTTYLEEEQQRRQMKGLMSEIHPGNCTFIADGKVYYKIKIGR